MNFHMCQEQFWKGKKKPKKTQTQKQNTKKTNPTRNPSVIHKYALKKIFKNLLAHIFNRNNQYLCVNVSTSSNV